MREGHAQSGNYFASFDDEESATRLLLRKETVLFILRLIEAEIEHPTDRNHLISDIKQLLLRLSYYAAGSFMITVADFVKVSNNSAAEMMKKVSNFIFTFTFLSPFVKLGALSFFWEFQQHFGDSTEQSFVNILTNTCSTNLS
nr:unnamed protein product [Callosobruchus chinensis]